MRQGWVHRYFIHKRGAEERIDWSGLGENDQSKLLEEMSYRDWCSGGEMCWLTEFLRGPWNILVYLEQRAGCPARQSQGSRPELAE